MGELGFRVGEWKADVVCCCYYNVMLGFVAERGS